jgi:hypothetical protein
MSLMYVASKLDLGPVAYTMWRNNEIEKQEQERKNKLPRFSNVFL